MVGRVSCSTEMRLLWLPTATYRTARGSCPESSLIMTSSQHLASAAQTPEILSQFPSAASWLSSSGHSAVTCEQKGSLRCLGH